MIPTEENEGRLAYVPVFITKFSPERYPDNDDSLLHDLIGYGSLHTSPGTARGQVTKFINEWNREKEIPQANRSWPFRWVIDRTGHVLVVDLMGMPTWRAKPDPVEELQEAERLMLYYAKRFDDVKRAIETNVPNEIKTAVKRSSRAG